MSVIVTFLHNFPFDYIIIYSRLPDTNRPMMASGIDLAFSAVNKKPYGLGTQGGLLNKIQELSWKSLRQICKRFLGKNPDFRNNTLRLATLNSFSSIPVQLVRLLQVSHRRYRVKGLREIS